MARPIGPRPGAIGLQELALTPKEAAEVERITADPTAHCPRPPRAFTVLDCFPEERCVICGECATDPDDSYYDEERDAEVRMHAECKREYENEQGRQALTDFYAPFYTA